MTGGCIGSHHFTQKDFTCHLPRHQSPRVKCRLTCVLAKGKYLFLQMVERGIEVGVWEALEGAQ